MTRLSGLIGPLVICTILQLNNKLKGYTNLITKLNIENQILKQGLSRGRKKLIQLQGQINKSQGRRHRSRDALHGLWPLQGDVSTASEL